MTTEATTKQALDPYERARKEKARGRKVIGVTPMHFPEELVEASGAMPVLLQESTEPVTVGNEFIWPNFCGFTRSNVDWGLRGKLDFLDAIIVSDICLALRASFNIMYLRMRVPFIYMWWPLEYDQQRWYEVARRRLGRVKGELEGIVGHSISDEALGESIRLYNRVRGLLRQVYHLRQQKPGLLTAREMQDLVVGVMVSPKEEAAERLESFVRELESRPARGDDPVRLFLSGHMCYTVKPDILDLIDDLGAVVVGDDLYIGYRYYAAQVPEDGDPLDALLRRYFDIGLPCPTKAGPQGDWAEHILAAVRETGAEGVVSLMPKFCEPHMFYHPYTRRRMYEAGVPFVFIETEHEAVSLGGVRTRLEAFVETIRARRI